MKITSPFKDFTNIEYFLMGLFILYLVVPFQTPHFLYKLLVNPVGLIFLLSVTVAMFFMTPPILAIVFVLVVYELLRRDGSNNKTYKAAGNIKDNTIQEYKYVSDPVINESIQSRGTITNKPTETDTKLEAKSETVYLPTGDTLEENIVSQSAPVQYSSENVNQSNFKPMNETSFGSSFM